MRINEDLVYRDLYFPFYKIHLHSTERESFALVQAGKICTTISFLQLNRNFLNRNFLNLTFYRAMKQASQRQCCIFLNQNHIVLKGPLDNI